MTGRTISHYQIRKKLGEGGMGVVYKAADTRLERPVALKFLVHHLVEDEEARARFIREAKAAAALDHPNICTVYDIDEVEGRTFIAMAYLEGQTVDEKVAERPLKLDDALDIAIQTAQGLQAAHEKSIVHRDIKSANLMVMPRGQVKIMDFGLAQLAERSKLTKTATMLGTPAYMSPEQVRRQPTDRRTDIWSLGVVIYEMVTARLPFESGHEQVVLYSIINENQEPITALRVGVPVELDRIVGKAMAKSAEERYQHVDDLLVDLRALRSSLENQDVKSAVAGPGDQEPPAVAVLPFVSIGRDEETEFFADGMTEDIINALTKVGDMRVVASRESSKFKGKESGSREIGEALKVDAILEGTVRRAGGRLRITAQLIDVKSGYQVWSERYDRLMENAFDIQDEISCHVVEALCPREGPCQVQVRRCCDSEGRM